jgi:hypothetical protein
VSVTSPARGRWPGSGSPGGAFAREVSTLLAAGRGAGLHPLLPPRPIPPRLRSALNLIGRKEIFIRLASPRFKTVPPRRPAAPGVGSTRQVPGAGLEPALPHGNSILSRKRLPFRHPGQPDLFRPSAAYRREASRNSATPRRPHDPASASRPRGTGAGIRGSG